MAIRATHVVPIPTPRAAEFVTVAAPAASAAGTVLPIDRIEQERTFWCWAACAQMILAFQGRTLSQCELANIALGRTDCCGTGAACNMTISVAPQTGEPNVMALYEDP